ncbi:hypothetical protein PHYSODRAFT_253972, partial [Phytophthora sojae]
MADYQKRVNSGNDLDYEALSKLTQFKAFKNNPEELQRHEPALLKEFYEVYLADQALKADAHAQTAGSGSPKLSQRGRAERLAIEQCDIQAAQPSSDQAPGPPISQTPVVVQEEGAPARSLQTHPLRRGHAKKLQDVHKDMNNLTREVDERKKKLEDRENEVATREKNMENKEEELQVKAEELQSHEAKLKEESRRLQNV